MSTLFTILAIAFMIAVAIVLIMGLRNMMVGGPGNTSQKLMRARVMLQAIAVAVIVGAIYFSR
ncbi:twin transmembrane helix small protein [Aureimonas sp. AU12]|uniref:twin transmembrane helix small protein n=1 Tax=Aureimonas sp. AU12 TaxID=1638161 RepID=UPI00078055CA|nr:twin transmembrane helix small protein [Aureimonas sp. AU12]